ncbi:MAG: caspase family protein [Bacteroidota bacterium]
MFVQKHLLTFFIAVLFYSSAFAQLGMQPTNIELNGSRTAVYKGSFALLIGMSNYDNGLPSLMGVSMDMAGIKQALENQGFMVILKLDIDLAGMEQAFSSFINTFGQDYDNRLLFYFAGHGYTLKTSLGEELGYIVPIDAPSPSADQAGFQNKAMEMAQIETYSKRIRSKHALFIFDACFSGSLFATSFALPSPISQKTLQPVRQFITSGTSEEQVPDKSIFCQQFLAAMEGEADNDGDGYVTGTELGSYLQKSVTNYSRESQHPQYGKIRNPNLDKGDFIFVIPTPGNENPVTTAAIRKPVSTSGSGEPGNRPGVPPTKQATPEAKRVEPETRTNNNISLQAPAVPPAKKVVPDYGELNILAEYSGDLFIDDVLYQTVIELTQTQLYNIPVGKHRLVFKGSRVYETEIEVRKDQSTSLIIK